MTTRIVRALWAHAAAVRRPARTTAALAGAVGLTAGAALWRPAECSPLFNGSPVAASLLMRQAAPVFEKHFPQLEMAAIFLVPEKLPAPSASRTSLPGETSPESAANEHAKEQMLSCFGYSETGALAWAAWPSAAECSVPVLPRFSELEEQELGRSGLYKRPVGRLVMSGACRYGCAQIVLGSIRLEKMSGEVVWEWRAPARVSSGGAVSSGRGVEVK